MIAWQDIILDPRKRHPFTKEELAYRFQEVKFNDYDAAQRTFWGTANTGTMDNDRECVLPGGADFSYFPTVAKTVYLNHNYDAPIGVCRTLSGNTKVIRAYTRLSKTGDAEDVAVMIEEGVLGGLSIGFKRMECGPPTAEEMARYPGLQQVTREWKMIEYSVTAMPCNPDAVIDTKSVDASLGKIDDLLRAGRIRRKSAVLCGLREAAKEIFSLTPIREPFEFMVTSGGTLASIG